MMVVSLKQYAELRGLILQEALEECKDAKALVYKGSKTLVDVQKATDYLENETIFQLQVMG